MFERFTLNARESVTGAQLAARELGHTWIGTEHILLGLLGRPDSIAGRALTDLGLSSDTVREAIAAELAGGAQPIGDAEALGTIGINLDEVRRRIEASFGPDALSRRPGKRGRRGLLSGHIPFTRRSKKVLELSLREALRLDHNYIGTEHILLGLVREGEGLAMLVLTRLGLSGDAIRTRVLDELRRAG